MSDKIELDDLFNAVHLEELRQQEEWGTDPKDAEKQEQFKKEIAALAFYRDAI